MNIREEKRQRVLELKAALTAEAMSTAQMAAKFGYTTNTPRKYMHALCKEPDGTVFVEKYILTNSVWVAHYRFGNGTSVPRPPGDKVASDRRAQEKLMSDPERKAAKLVRRRQRYKEKMLGLPPRIKVGRPAVRAQEALTPEQIEERNEQISLQREQYERAARIAAIKPHKDPYAWFMFGGAKQLAGVRAW